MTRELGLAALFVEEAGELLSDAEQALLLLESLPDDVELLNRIFRCAHTLKGNAKMLGLTVVVRFTHALENLLDRLRKDELLVNEDLANVLLASFDLLKAMVAEIGGAAPHDAQTCALLQARIEAAAQPAMRASPVQSEPAAQSAKPGAVVASVAACTEEPARAQRASASLAAGPRAVVQSTQPEAHVSEPSQCSQYVTFSLGGGEYAVAILDVQEFKRYDAITPVPNTPAYVRGVMNLRGVIIPVYDLRVRFGMRADLSAFTVIVVAVISGRTVGLVVDTVSDVLDIAAADIQETPELSARAGAAFLRGMAKVEDRLVILLNLERLIVPEGELPKPTGPAP